MSIQTATRSNLETVLILEDDFFSVALLEMSLQDAGYKTVHFSDTDQALNCIETSPPDILLSDWSLGGSVSTAEVARRLRKKNPNAKIVFVTGYQREDIPDNLLDLEPLEFIVKPIDFGGLAERIASKNFAMKIG